MASDWALNARRTELYAFSSSWCISLSISFTGALKSQIAPETARPFPVRRALFVPPFTCDGGRSSSVPEVWLQMKQFTNVKMSKHVVSPARADAQRAHKYTRMHVNLQWIEGQDQHNIMWVVLPIAAGKNNHYSRNEILWSSSRSSIYHQLTETNCITVHHT